LRIITVMLREEKNWKANVLVWNELSSRSIGMIESQGAF
jgi:hypothetical protein